MSRRGPDALPGNPPHGAVAGNRPFMVVRNPHRISLGGLCAFLLVLSALHVAGTLGLAPAWWFLALTMASCLLWSAMAPGVTLTDTAAVLRVPPLSRLAGSGDMVIPYGSVAGCYHDPERPGILRLETIGGGVYSLELGRGPAATRALVRVMSAVESSGGVAVTTGQK